MEGNKQYVRERPGIDTTNRVQNKLPTKIIPLIAN